MIERYARLAERLTKALQLPEDISRGNVLLSLHGQQHLWIENFKGISSYTEEEIQLTAKGKIICISGKKLQIAAFTKDEIEITGYIQKLEYR
ncbi:MAG: YabP/YqfC family sporulation protein [Lachnospiraceae bacterium]|nr:YabP/YqfC family sporulation protein [Lachnospiraceae bacterium]